MYFQIRKLILWPRNRALKARIVHFRLGAVNVVTGASQTGKSAIIPIIDYCLGSAKCSIPVNIIRNTTEWFGIVVSTIKGEVLFARKEPGPQQSTGEMFVLEGQHEISIPDHISAKNANQDFVKTYLDELSGLSSLEFEPESESGFKGRPSFRDMAAFNFQPQNIVANPEVLFFKADTLEHREKLRTIFPYVLGVLTPEIMAKRFRLEELRRDERGVARQLESLRQSSQRLLAELHIYLSRAREFGLLPNDTPRDVDQNEALRLLRRIVSRTDQPEITSNGFTSISQELIDLRHREAELSLELTQVRQRWLEMNRLRDAAIEYRRALQTEEDRLAISRWLLEQSQEQHVCPVCGNAMAQTHQHLQDLVKSLADVEGAQTLFRTLPPTFDREYVRVRSRIGTLTQRLNGVQRRIRALQEASDNERRRRYTELNISRFVGKVESELALFDRFNSDDELRKRQQELLAEIANLVRDVDEKSLKDSERRAIDRVSALSSPLLEDLGVENPQNPIRLSTTDLTLRIQSQHREDLLSEIGSGSNWLGYHLAISLGLQRYFLQLKNSPVPSFLVFDQPSQVFFPKKLAGALSKDALDPKLDDDDVLRVRKLFEVITKIVTEQKQAFQVIVLDHAAENVWGSISDIRLVEEWRGNKKLVPLEWLT